MKSTLKKAFVTLCIISFAAAPALAQSECSEENQTLFDTCVSDAVAACKVTYPGCEESALSVISSKAPCWRCVNLQHGRTLSSCSIQTDGNGPLT